MSREDSIFKAIPQSTLRQWRSTPTYFFLIWRWGTWIFALVRLITLTPPIDQQFAWTLRIGLIFSFIYTLVVTLYTPITRVLTLRQSRKRKASRARKTRRRLPGSQDGNSILRPLLDTRNVYLNAAIYCLDVVICGLLTYFCAVDQGVPFGASSPFYRYGLSAVLVAGFTYGYPGGLLAALGYSLFSILGAFIPPPGQNPALPAYNLAFLGYDISASTIDAPLIALLAAFVAGQLNKAIASKRREQENVRRERVLRGVSETLVTGSSDQVQLLRSTVKALRQGGHFEKLVIALIKHDKDKEPHPDFDTYAEAVISDAEHPDVSEELVILVAKTGRPHKSFDLLSSPSNSAESSDYGIARLYLPFFQDKRIYLVIGAESTRYTPFDKRQEEFLAIIGPQLIVALENIRLTAETAELATVAERTRISREIHDGVAQLLYMLSLNSETCMTLLERAAALSDETRRALAPVNQNLEKMVAISKQALWETRHYMFMLRPMLSGDTTLTQMLASQLREFEAISGLPTHLKVEGNEELRSSDQQRNLRKVQVGTAIFRITQEALTNAYKHAEASKLEVHLHHLPDRIRVEISDNGKGLKTSDPLSHTENVYSGRGLQGMRERAMELGGTLEIGSNSSSGTCVLASIPL